LGPLTGFTKALICGGAGLFACLGVVVVLAFVVTAGLGLVVCAFVLNAMADTNIGMTKYLIFILFCYVVKLVERTD
jgi:hypothetical protein